MPVNGARSSRYTRLLAQEFPDGRGKRLDVHEEGVVTFQRRERHEVRDGARVGERVGKGVLFVDGEEDVRFHADDQCAFRRGSLECGGCRATMRGQIETIDGA